MQIAISLNSKGPHKLIDDAIEEEIKTSFSMHEKPKKICTCIEKI